MREQRTCNQPHGTFTRYIAGCSCLECCNAWAEYQRDRRADPGPRLVDIEPVRQHIAYLRNQRGMSRRAIAEAAGVSYNTVRGIHKRWRPTVHRDTAAAIMSLTGPILSESTALIEAKTSLRIIERLKSEGFSKAEIAEAVGVAKGSMPLPDQRRIQSRRALLIKDGARTLRARSSR